MTSAITNCHKVFVLLQPNKPSDMNGIDVCLSPDLIHLYNIEDKAVVIVDILRATSCMTAGIAFGIASITPFANLNDCRAMKAKGYFIAGERNGKKVEGFDLGNSPYDYKQPHLKGKKIAVTTTNGTLAIEKSKAAPNILIGSFLNKSAITRYLLDQPMDVLVLCAGWKGKFNLEDTLFAGALVDALQEKFAPSCDAPMAAKSLYLEARADMRVYLQYSSHVQRLQKLDIGKDIGYCLTENVINVVPMLNDQGEIVGH